MTTSFNDGPGDAGKRRTPVPGALGKAPTTMGHQLRDLIADWIDTVRLVKRMGMDVSLIEYEVNEIRALISTRRFESNMVARIKRIDRAIEDYVVALNLLAVHSGSQDLIPIDRALRRLVANT